MLLLNAIAVWCKAVKWASHANPMDSRSFNYTVASSSSAASRAWATHAQIASNILSSDSHCDCGSCINFSADVESQLSPLDNTCSPLPACPSSGCLSVPAHTISSSAAPRWTSAPPLLGHLFSFFFFTLHCLGGEPLPAWSLVLTWAFRPPPHILSLSLLFRNSQGLKQQISSFRCSSPSRSFGYCWIAQCVNWVREHLIHQPKHTADIVMIKSTEQFTMRLARL